MHVASRLTSLPPTDRRRRVLAIGAHADDIEIGCGGTLMRLLDSGHPPDVTFALLSADDRRREEAIESARLFDAPTPIDVKVAEFRDSYFPAQYEAIKSYLHELIGAISPDWIFVHRDDDAHQDHRLLGQLASSVARGPLILHYEIPKWDGDLRPVNTYVELDDATVERKLRHLETTFESQQDRAWYDRETFAALMRIRGCENSGPHRHAEGFRVSKTILSF